MKYFKRIFSAAVMVLILCCLPSLLQAQPDPGCDPAIDPACIPIDGGLGFLIAAGVAYGIKKVRDSRKQHS